MFTFENGGQSPNYTKTVKYTEKQQAAGCWSCIEMGI